MKWLVEKYVAPEMLRGTPRHIREEKTEPVEVVADELSVENGALVFTAAGAVKQAFGAGAWLTVSQAPAENAASGETVEGSVVE